MQRSSRAAPQATYDPDCRRCARLAAFRARARHEHPGYWARPVPSFGAAAPGIVIVGLAPGMHGANRTGRPFTGDHAGILLYQTLYDAGLSTAPVSASAEDGLELVNARIVNSVKCVPPENRPLPREIRNCNPYLAAELGQLTAARVYLTLGRVAHDALLMARGLRRSAYPFAHGREHRLEGGAYILDSYHCSRYNTATGRLTAQMFRVVVGRACELAGLPVPAALRRHPAGGRARRS